MTQWVIERSDGTRTQIEADEITDRTGSLWLLLEIPRRPAKLPMRLIPVLVLARGEWTAVYPAGEQILWDTPPPETVQEQDIPRAAPARARILEQCTDSELAEARRQVIADRLAGIGGTEDDS